MGSYSVRRTGDSGDGLGVRATSRADAAVKFGRRAKVGPGSGLFIEVRDDDRGGPWVAYRVRQVLKPTIIAAPYKESPCPPK